MGRSMKDNSGMEDDIGHFPSNIIELRESITMGDLHGNGVLMLYFLIKNKVLQLKSPADYGQFLNAHTTLFRELVSRPYVETVKIRKNQPAGVDVRIQAQDCMRERLTHKLGDTPDLQQSINERRTSIQGALGIIRRIIRDATITDKECTVRFIGDMLADRGPCDFSTLLLLKKLQENQSKNIDVRVLLSNHDQSFLAHLPFEPNSEYEPNMLAPQEVSLQSMITLIQTGLLDPDEINEIVRQFYLPTLKLIDVSHSTVPYTDPADNKIKRKFYTHAPMDIGHLKVLVDYFLGRGEFDKVKNEIDFNAMTDKVNQVLQKKLTTGLSLNDMAIIREFVWIREKDVKLDRREALAALGMVGFNGHDGQQDISLGILNGDIGKSNFQDILYGFSIQKIGDAAVESWIKSGQYWVCGAQTGTPLHGTGSGVVSSSAVTAGAAAQSGANTTAANAAIAGAAADTTIAGAVDLGLESQTGDEENIENQIVAKFFKLHPKSWAGWDYYSRLEAVQKRPTSLANIVAHANSKEQGGFFSPAVGTATRDALKKMGVENVTPGNITKAEVIAAFKNQNTSQPQPKP